MLLRRLAAVLVMTSVCAEPASAQAGAHALVESSSPLAAALSANGRFVAWADGTSIAVADLQQGGAQAAYPLAALVPPSVYGSLVARIFGVSDDGRYLTYGVDFSPPTGRRSRWCASTPPRRGTW